MPEARQITFTYEELAEILVKQQGIHEGLWGVYYELGIGAGNLPAPDGNFIPAALVPLQRMGIQKFDEEVKGLTVDAAKVNPIPERQQEESS
jgi:hypothetical protein